MSSRSRTPRPQAANRVPTHGRNTDAMHPGMRRMVGTEPKHRPPTTQSGRRPWRFLLQPPADCVGSSQSIPRHRAIQLPGCAHLTHNVARYRAPTRVLEPADRTHLEYDDRHGECSRPRSGSADLSGRVVRLLSPIPGDIGTRGGSDREEPHSAPSEFAGACHPAAGHGGSGRGAGSCRIMGRGGPRQPSGQETGVCGGLLVVEEMRTVRWPAVAPNRMIECGLRCQSAGAVN